MIKGLVRSDMEEMRKLAAALNGVPDPRRRMQMQQDFVRRMKPRIGAENAARLLTQVWALAKRMKQAEAE